ncbi:uncharacterized protein LOC128990243 [Macrosteles quadrilineatus]|uniref:uncharacterized protein LOC128990243 n=1 Tax=Macrosteles quadrilineatus TaxID=74068 RepID=UPI0023E10A5F|nr:uncharacterized protein LOC128990243 [Macrosteles quadrilineatus]
MDSERMAMENKKSSKLNFTPGGLKQKFSSTNDHKNYPILGRGEGDVNVNFDLSKVSMGSSNNCQLTQHGVSLFPSAPQRQNCYNSGFFEGNLSTPNGNLFNIGCETSSVPPANEMCASFGNPFALSMSNCFPVNIQQTMPVTSPLINNQFSHVNSNPYQNAVSSCLEKPKPNPILCTDLDFDGNLAKNSYMKPGQYAPPQKPPCIQKTVSNSVPISDIPIVGIPFLYTTQQSDSQQPSIELQTGYSKLKVSKCIEDTDNTLVSDNSMVGCLKESYLGNNVGDVSNLKSSEVSTTSHFLLDDNNWNGLIGDDMKVNNDFDISSPSSSGSSETDPSIIVELKNTSTDWLVDSLKKISLEGEQSLKSSAVEDKVQDQVERTNPSDGCNGQDKQSLQPQFALTHSTRDVTEQNKDGMVQNNPEKPSQLLKTNTEHYQKKPKKIKNGRESYNLADRRSHSSHGRPETMVFATSMSDKVTCQLEEILNCIWNTPAATLIEDGIRNEKEGARLELRVRSPLYFQAMRCKLSNRSYDTLDQALSDFHQYFIDIRSRNKGDKMCSDAVDALEQIFFDQVEKHFGLTYQALSQNGCHFGENTINKARKQKKTPRRF